MPSKSEMMRVILDMASFEKRGRASDGWYLKNILNLKAVKMNDHFIIILLRTKN